MNQPGVELATTMPPGHSCIVKEAECCGSEGWLSRGWAELRYSGQIYDVIGCCGNGRTASISSRASRMSASRCGRHQVTGARLASCRELRSLITHPSRPGSPDGSSLGAMALKNSLHPSRCPLPATQPQQLPVSPPGASRDARIHEISDNNNNSPQLYTLSCNTYFIPPKKTNF